MCAILAGNAMAINSVPVCNSYVWKLEGTGQLLQSRRLIDCIMCEFCWGPAHEFKQVHVSSMGEAYVLGLQCMSAREDCYICFLTDLQK